MTTDEALQPARRENVLRWLLALAPTVGAFVIHLMLRPLVEPAIWFLFYPAVFLSSWIGGLRAAVVSAAVCAAGALWFLAPPAHSFKAAPGQYLAAGVFITTGIFFGLFHDRLRAANRRIESALAASKRGNERLESAMRERRLLSALVENSSDFIGIANPSGMPIYINPAGRRMVGLPADYPIERTALIDYYSPDQRSLVLDTIAKSTAEKGHWEGETAFRHWQTQESIPVSYTRFMIRDPESGEALGMGTVTRDISEIKQARVQLEHANDAIAALIEQAPDGILVSDRDCILTDINRAGCLMLGCKREELIGKRLFDLVPREVERLQRGNEQLPEAGPHVAELTLRRKDGSGVPVEICTKVLRDGRWQLFVRDVSARKELEAAIRQGHADLTRAQSVAKVGCWRLDVRRNNLAWSDESYRVFGVPLGTPMTYDGFLALVHPDDRAWVDRAWSAAQRGEPYDIEHRVVVDGEVKWVREKADLEFDEHGALVGGIGISQDITERKQHEEELREARERVELALRGADLAAWDWNIESGAVVFSPRWAEMRGLRPDEVVGHVDSWIALIHPDDRPRVHQAVDDYLHGRAPEYETVHRVRTKTGQWIWVLDRGKVFRRNAKGEPLRMVGTELDITARKNAEEELRLAEHEQRLLAEVGTLLAETLDYEETLHTIARLATRELADFCIVDVIADGETRRATVESRAPAGEAICESFRALNLDRSRPHLMRGAFETKETQIFERISAEMLASFAQSEEHLRALRALDAKSLIVAPFMVHGELLGALALVSSGESRVYGPQDARLAEELALRAALAIESALLYRRSMRAIQAREDVLGIVAHDLRNPLTTILMQATRIRRSGREDERLSGAAQAIERAASRMRRLIEDLLDVTRIEAGRLAVEPSALPAAEVIAESMDAQRALAASASIDIQADVKQPLPVVWADRDRLLQVFENLIGNAIKFTGPGGRVTIGAAPRDREVLFWVADSGAGIAAEDLPHVFDEFWQAAHAKRAGAGLGLPIVKGIIEAHGGRVWVESTLGRGSIFFFVVPTAARAERFRPAHVT